MTTPPPPPEIFNLFFITWMVFLFSTLLPMWFDFFLIPVKSGTTKASCTMFRNKWILICCYLSLVRSSFLHRRGQLITSLILKKRCFLFALIIADLLDFIWFNCNDHNFKSSLLLVVIIILDHVHPEYFNQSSRLDWWQKKTFLWLVN